MYFSTRALPCQHSMASFPFSRRFSTWQINLQCHENKKSHSAKCSRFLDATNPCKEPTRVFVRPCNGVTQ